MSSSTKKKRSSRSESTTKTPLVRSSTRAGKGRNQHRGISSNNRELRETQSFKSKHYTTLVYLHVRITKNQCNPSSEIVVVPCPYLYCELKGLNQNLSFEHIKDKILSAVASEVFVQKYGDKVLYDSTTGVIGWKGRRDFDENPKKALKDKASFEIDGDEEWNHHRRRYATRYFSEPEQRKDLIIDLGIAVYKNESAKNKSSSTSAIASKKSKTTSAKKKRKVDQTFVFRAPYKLVVHVCKPVEMDTKHGEKREKTGGVDAIGTVTINFDQYVLERNRFQESDSDSDENNDDIPIIDNGVIADVLKSHIYEGIRHTLANRILDDSKFKVYHKSIGKKVRIIIMLMTELNKQFESNFQLVPCPFIMIPRVVFMQVRRSVSI